MARRDLQSRREKREAEAARAAKAAPQRRRRPDPWVPPSAPQDSGPGWRAPALVVVIFLVVVLGYTVIRSDGPALEVDDVEAATVSIFRGPLPDGHTFGGPVVRNTSDKPVVIERVEILWKGPERKTLGAYIFDSRRSRDLAEDDLWPPRLARRSYARKVPGATIDPGENVQFVVGAAFRGQKSTWFDHIRVRYRIGGVGHIQDLPMRVWHCPTLTHDACTREQAEHERRDD